ncbi:MAG: hypothetical protein NZM31_00795 [Gemmatales bacterium]|nr:hypothetical protein [Gemmatales bacterium]MDW8385531.1 hypothetical protein [Gemmatales bacterium]
MIGRLNLRANAPSTLSRLCFVLVFVSVVAIPRLTSQAQEKHVILQRSEVKAPLLFVRVQGPEGMAVTFLDSRGGRTFDQPVTVGLRPSFIYRLRLSGFPNRPGVNFYASLEVRSTLHLPPRQKASEFPAPVIFSEADAESALAGVLVTKVIGLEDAEKTALGPLFSGQPAEVSVNPEDDPLKYAQMLGRPLLIVRLGTREPEAAEVARLGPGMILFPDMVSLPPPSSSQLFHKVPPELPLKGLLDPLEECLRDGGDQGTPAHFNSTGRIGGLDPSDTVAEYRDSTGRLKLKPSNVVCIFVPRWFVVKHETGLSRFDAAKAISAVDAAKRQNLLAEKQNSRPLRGLKEAEQFRHRQRLEAARSTDRATRVETVKVLQGTEIDIGLAAYLGTKAALTLRDEDKLRLARQFKLAQELQKEQAPAGTQAANGPQAVGHVVGLGQVTGSADLREFSCICMPGEPELPEKPLYLCKWASTDAAQVGDVITFYIKYVNLGGKPIQDIAISDSLTGRLEYVPGSAKSDREAVFVTQENDAGSLILRWEIRDPLPPGKKGVVSFQARVR